MKCPNCSYENAGDARFCASCGLNLSAVPAAPPVIPSMVQAQPPQTPFPSQPAGTAPAVEEGAVSQCVGAGWRLIWKNLPFALVTFLIMGVICALDAGVGALFEDSRPVFYAVWRLAFSVLVWPAIAAGVAFEFLKIVRGDTGNIRELFAGFGPKLAAIVVCNLLLFLAVIGGLILLIIPGIIIGLGFSQAILLVMDRDLQSIDALKESWRLMKGRKAELFLLHLALIGINILGALCFGVGLIVTVGISMFAIAAFYQRVTVVKT